MAAQSREIHQKSHSPKNTPPRKDSKGIQGSPCRRLTLRQEGGRGVACRFIFFPFFFTGPHRATRPRVYDIFSQFLSPFRSRFFWFRDVHGRALPRGFGTQHNIFFSGPISSEWGAEGHSECEWPERGGEHGGSPLTAAKQGSKTAPPRPISAWSMKTRPFLAKLLHAKDACHGRGARSVFRGVFGIVEEMDTPRKPCPSSKRKKSNPSQTCPSRDCRDARVYDRTSIRPSMT